MLFFPRRFFALTQRVLILLCCAGMAMANAADLHLPIGPILQAPRPDGVTVMFESTADDVPQAARVRVWQDHQAAAQSFAAQPHAADARVRHARLHGLKSDTRYHYQIELQRPDGVWQASPVYQFRSWPESDSRKTDARFLLISDTQHGRARLLNDIVERGMIVHECDGDAKKCTDRVAGILIAGDLVGNGGRREEWREQLFERMRAITPYVPLIPAPGNHEYFGEDMGDPAKRQEPDREAAIRSYRMYFAGIPDHSEGRFPQHWYALDYAGLRVLSLDTSPISGRHAHDHWTPMSMYWDDFRVQQLNWFKAQLRDAAARKLPFVFSLQHGPCLSEKWRNGEIIAACEFVSALEKYAADQNAMTGHLFGHAHTYARGHSMNARHLWINPASASGALEGDGNQGADGRDLGVFVVTHDEYGYNRLQFTFGAQAALAVERRSSGAEGRDLAFPVSDAFALHSAKVPTPLRIIARTSLRFHLEATAQTEVYEVQWQFSKHANFSEAFDVWGNETRRENRFYTSTRSDSFTDTQAGKNPLDLDLRALLASRTVWQDGGSEIYERWSRAKGSTCWTREEPRGGQCTHRSDYDPFLLAPPATLTMKKGERWFVRARVRDAQLNWSGWSPVLAFAAR